MNWSQSRVVAGDELEGGTQVSDTGPVVRGTTPRSTQVLPDSSIALVVWHHQLQYVPLAPPLSPTDTTLASSEETDGHHLT